MNMYRIAVIKQALNEHSVDDKKMTLRIKLTDVNRFRIEVPDNGVDIPD